MSKTIPPICPEPEVGPKYWRSLDQLADTPAFRQWLEREFPAGASEFTDPTGRRHFVKIMSASFMLAGLGLTGCRRPEEKILPFSKLPENLGYTHGVPEYFATAMPTRGTAIPLVVKSSDGRPTKIEGNAEHPINQFGEHKHGGTDAFAQASILNLYDPDRAMRYTRNGTAVSREAAVDELGKVAQQAETNKGEGLAFLLERSSSPTRERLVKQLSDKYPNARWHIHEPVDFDIHREAATKAFGQPVTPYYKFDEASVIVSLDCDFLGTEEDSYLNIRRFAKGRRIKEPTDKMNRLYAVEGLMTLTGANADHRLRVPTSHVAAVAYRLAMELGGQGTGFQAQSEPVKAHEKWIVECAKDLAASKGSALVVAGHRQPLAVHLLALAINSSLGSIGKTVAYLPAAEPKAGTIADLAKALHDGKVDTLVILGGNPVYSAPADLQWVQAQGKAGTVIRLGYYEDESFPVKGWQLPQAHYLESWGDARTADGTVVPIQPLIEPLFGGVTEIEVLARIGGVAKSSPYDLVRETFGTDEEKWKRFLHDGFLAGSAHTPMDVRQPAGSVGANDYKPLPAPTKEKLEIVFHRDYSVDDGRFNNNGWLQEMPDPISKMTWENVVLMSAKTAKELGVFLDDTEGNNLHASLVQVELGGQKIIGPVWTQPGMADYTLGLALGYGRRRTGRVGEGSGFNAYALRTSGAPHIASGAKLTVLGATQLLATTQSHWSMEGRPIIREATARQYREQPHFADGMDLPKPPSTPADGSPVALYPNPLDKLKAGATHQWGMSIDLNACVGCSACVMACQSENNVPIVGKDQVSRNREMHWLRIDRYYAGDPTKSLDAQIADPQVVTQPMLCQHCESAPCESVCPVNATVHDEEGLNVMVYNRCVGTRYCSNNCPYKVRRFNYFDFNKRPLNDLYRSPFGRNKDGQWELLRWLNNVDKGTVPDDQWELLKLAKNPDVSVRMRGVMEKCTFCIQRIEHAKITQKVKAGASGDVEVPDDTIKTACQQACPAEAIVFGNVKDKHSRVSQFKEQPRDYAVLEFLGTKPRLTYLARIRNPNPAMPDAYEAPLTSKEFESKMGGGHAPDPAHSPKASPEKKGAH